MRSITHAPRPFVRSAGFAASTLLIAGAIAWTSDALSQPASTSNATNRATASERLSEAAVRRLQHSLMQGGYAIDATDGVWGPKTQAAVREFQRVKGLPSTGMPDDRTLAALGLNVDASPGQTVPIRRRSPTELSKATILAIQQSLKQKGMEIGSVDGVWGDQTVTALGNFQHARGMPASGELDAATVAALGLLPGGEKMAAPRSGQPLRTAQLDPAAIRMIQQALESKGHQPGASDGVWGERSDDALRAFQKANGLEPLGEAEVFTLAALGLLPEDRPAPRTRAPVR